MSEDEDGEWADLPPLVLPPLGDLPPLLDDGPPGLIADDEVGGGPFLRWMQWQA